MTSTAGSFGKRTSRLSENDGNWVRLAECLLRVNNGCDARSSGTSAVPEIADDFGAPRKLAALGQIRPFDLVEPHTSCTLTSRPFPRQSSRRTLSTSDRFRSFGRTPRWRGRDRTPPTKRRCGMAGWLRPGVLTSPPGCHNCLCKVFLCFALPTVVRGGMDGRQHRNRPKDTNQRISFIAAKGGRDRPIPDTGARGVRKLRGG
jgi:hypothetical protein